MALVIPMIGAQVSRRSITKEFTLGTAQMDDQNQTWVYVRASEVVATGTCTVGATFLLTDAAGNYTADVAFLSGDYGWVRKTATPL
jgi:hypothetical protein